MKKFKLYNNLLGWVIFLVAAVVYLLTIEPTASLWDCGEFIASSYRFQVGHPPGAPFFMLMAKFFSLFAGHDVTKVAKMINSMSALASAFTIMFLFWTITHLARKIAVKDGEISLAKGIAVLGSGVVGALAYTFSDTFWFSAVEAEVYASSSLFTAVVFWAILKWENVAGKPYANRWIILIAYLMGVSIGVHLLNLLAIPAIVLVYYFKNYKVERKGVILAILISIIILGSVMYIIIPGLIWLGSQFELAFVNGMGLPYNTGVLIYAALLIGSLVYGVIRTYRAKKVLFNTILVGISVIILGYSSYTMIVIRSWADPPMDENNPDNVFSLLSYLNRDQYGERPLFFGQYFNAQPVATKEGKPTYSQIDGKYKITNRKISYVYDKKYTTFFPRMWSSQNDHIDEYINWAGLNERDLYQSRLDKNGNVVHDSQGNVMYDRSKPLKSPTFIQNLKFFFSYQVGYMYLRYFMWNFAGRQNDEQGDGGPLHGNWISGINFIDNMRVGNQADLPADFKNEKSRNTFYFLPLLLGLLGLVYQLQKNNKDFWVVMFLFIFTGLAIVVYLNQTPLQPRERDYAYAGSFYAFAIWIGLGVLGIFDSLGNKYKGVVSAGAITLASLVLVPGRMAQEDWNDHDRSGRYTTRDIAADYLNSCAPNAILFTNGDNDTFPLWYDQEVEGIRTDVRVVNLMLLNMDWYIDQMKRKAYQSDPLPITLKHEQYLMGTRDFVYVQERTKQAATLKEIMDFVASDNPQTKIQTNSGNTYDYIPTRNFILPVDTSAVLKNGTVKEADASKIVPEIKWRFNRGSLGKSELIVLDILAHNNWKRPVYYVTLNQSGTLGLDDYMQLEGLAYRLVPIKTSPANRYEAGRIAPDIMYENLMHKFKYGRMNAKDVYLDNFHKHTISIIRLRSRFAQLADTLINQGKTDKAIKVLDRCVELTPQYNVPYDFAMIGVANEYYKVNEFDKGNKIMSDYLNILDGHLTYYFSLGERYINGIQNDMRYDLQAVRSISLSSKNYKQDKIYQRADSLFNDNLEKYSRIMSNQ